MSIFTTCTDGPLDFVAAAARSESRSDPAGDEAWWAAAGPALAEVLDPSSYPLATRVGTAAGEARRSARHPDAAWAFGTARVLDGLAALIDGAGFPGAGCKQ